MLLHEVIGIITDDIISLCYRRIIDKWLIERVLASVFPGHLRIYSSLIRVRRSPLGKAHSVLACEMLVTNTV
jgi:hypothetical protein